MNARPLFLVLSGSMLGLVASPGWTGGQPRPAAAPREVRVSRPLISEGPDHVDFTGRTEAAASVRIRARVTGYLDKVRFKDGAEVKQGEVLFEIDPRPYQAELDKAQAEVALSEADLKLAEAKYKRTKALHATKAASQADVETADAERVKARAQVAAARAGFEVARLRLAFTKVTAPFAGRIGRRLVDAGGLVRADETALAVLVTNDPVYVYFDMDERTYLRLRRAKREGKADVEAQVTVGLADEKGFPRRGKIDFVDNQVDPKTGTIRMRVVCPNAKGLMLPGLFVRVRLKTGKGP
jgi:RND family efflux transporter MFP subunit